ncbi:diol dehydratase reactivase subunit alpha [Alteribacillus sp. JSM 102045]|uniref:diol dehydratase reactivase subunit alpha n=1 Tax=Alteribacillus sp. JSM 102045 TaxID=1562101 RepID=UPI0035C09B02
MKHELILAGVDIGNSTTEVSIARVSNEHTEFLSQYLTKTTGIKGTIENVKGIQFALNKAAAHANLKLEQIDKIRINDAVPVIGDLAMDMISETIITESSMIGHNPDTPGGSGLGVGETVLVESLFDELDKRKDYVVIISKNIDFEWASMCINKSFNEDISIKGAIVQNDDGVLIYNRLINKIPIVDEVALIEKVPLGKIAAVEVAQPGYSVRSLSNPYSLATVFQLSAEETTKISPIAKAVVGNRSAVVIRTPAGEVVDRKIKAGKLILIGPRQSVEADVTDGASTIMEKYEQLEDLVDLKGEKGTNVGGMLNGLRQELANLTSQRVDNIQISDFLAVDAVIPTSVKGALAGEVTMESGVALASMVKTDQLPVERVAKELEEKLALHVEVGGIEAEMAIRGALTTPGTGKSIAILDMGGGSTDAALVHNNGSITSTHLAGAGDMVTMLINSELDLGDKELAERIKKFPLGKVMSLFHMQLEDGTIHFSKAPYPPHTFGRVVIREGNELTPITNASITSIEKVREVRRSAKKRVFVTNTIRALKRVSPTNNLKHLSYVVMLGGSALDFEIPQMITEELFKYGIVAGFGNIRGTEGPRNAVATGLILSSSRGEVPV